MKQNSVKSNAQNQVQNLIMQPKNVYL